MVKSITAKVNDELYDQALEKAANLGLNKSQIVRYAFALLCEYSTEDAKLMALISPDVAYSGLRTGE